LLQREEQILIAEFKKGSVHAFDSLYQMYAHRLYAFCKTYTKQSDDAKDIVQEAFLHLWQVRESIRAEASLQSLLFTMVRNRALNYLAARVNSPVFEDYVDYANELAVDADGDRRMEYTEFMHKVDDEVEQLPASQRNIFRLSRFECLSNKEIAERLSLSEQTVKNQLTKALKQLRERLGSADRLLPLFIISFLL
jgi:RNA polymerase sigma-70 factor (ECF subfamily)